MKSLIFCILTLITLSLWSCVSLTYAIENPLNLPNNKFGIHILDPGELGLASELVNSNGGDWGYVTIPIQAVDRDKDKWQAFMHEAKQKHLIPILRITTIPQGGTWQKGRDTDLVDFANFLNDLDWPVTNRYVIIFNEVNRSTEWGGQVEPEKYAEILKNAHTIFKERSDNFFILPAGLDNALPRSSTSMRSQDYLRAMMVKDPAIWSYIDGLNSHSYPNPAFSAPPTAKGWTSITSYKQELAFLKIAEKPIFITETGWVNTKLGEEKRAAYLQTAMQIWQQEKLIVAVTPFLLTAGAGDFVPFSFTNHEGKSPSFVTYQAFGKVKGEPTQNGVSTKQDFNSESKATSNDNFTKPIFKPFKALIKLENIFRQILGLTTKKSLQAGNNLLTVELATSSKNWETGLSEHSTLGENSGMYFIFPELHVPLFWMKGMHFPIDIIWIQDDAIVDFTLNAPVPQGINFPTYSPRQSVNRVLEVPAGYVESHGLAIGDQVTLIDD